MTTITDPIAWGAAAVALLVLVGPALLLVRRAARSRATAPGTEVGTGTGTGTTVRGPQTRELRALRAQVRTLEQALEQLPDVGRELAVPEPAVPEPARLPVVAADVAAQDVAGAVEAHRRQVALTVRALARTTPDDEDPQRTLARVVAAVDRLGAPAGFVRPILASREGSVPSRLPTPTGPARRPVLASSRPATPVEVASAVARELDVSHVPAALEPSQPDVPAGPEVVLPVPPPAPEAPRRRRRLRRQAA